MSQRLQNISTQMEIILSAIYMSTGHVSDKSVIKQALRSEALQIMAKTIELIGDENITVEQGENKIISLKSGIKVNIYKSMSFIKILKSETLMSDSNAELLIMTYSKLLAFISNYQSAVLYTLSDSLRDIDYKLYTDTDNINRHSIDTANVNHSFINTASNIINNNTYNKNKTTNSILTQNKTERRSHILNILKSNNINTADFKINNTDDLKMDGCNMSEILKNIRSIDNTELKTISEKTVQRELNTMIADHLITKKGDKRWSRYVLLS